MKHQVVESLFLGGLPVPEARDLTRALVLGGDRVGVELAHRLDREGLQVIVLGEPEPTFSNRNITHLPHTTLEEVRGFIGGFDVVLKTADGPLTERVGFVVAAAPARILPKFVEYRLAAATGVISLTDLENRLGRGEILDARKQEWAHVAFLCGMEGESHPAIFRRVLGALEKLAILDKVQTYVFCRNLKVAEAGLERRYRESRERGTVYFKFENRPAMCEQSPERVTVIFEEPLLGEEMELSPDLLVVDENLFPPASIGPILATIPSSPSFAPFLQPESLRFPGVETPRAGFYAVGPSRGVYSPELIASDMEAVVASLRKSVTYHGPHPAQDGRPAERLAESRLHLPHTNLPGPPQVDETRCVMCLTCVRLCPHGAMGFHRRAEADPESCVRCGICAAECPMQAISLAPAPGEEDLDRKVQIGLAGQEASQKIVAFLCRRSAMDALIAAGPEIGRHLIIVPVTCAGTVGVPHILSAFRQGAAAVLVAGCFRGNCASIYGTTLAAQRTAETGTILEAAGMFPGSVSFVPCAANNPVALAGAVRDLEESLHLARTTA